MFAASLGRLLMSGTAASESFAARTQSCAIAGNGNIGNSEKKTAAAKSIFFMAIPSFWEKPL